MQKIIIYVTFLLSLFVLPMNAVAIPKNLEDSAQKGDAEAQYLLGRMYESSVSVMYDRDIAKEWYKKSAEQGNSKAQYFLAHIYIELSGLNNDDVALDEAQKWFEKSAQQGNSKAQYTLGNMFIRGRFFDENPYGKAKEWFEKSAELGEPEAQYTLGLMYTHDSRAGARDDVKANDWFKKACDNHYGPACDAYKAMNW